MAPDASDLHEEANKNEKEESQEERQTQIRAEAVAFALSGLTASDVRRGSIVTTATPKAALKKKPTPKKNRVKFYRTLCRIDGCDKLPQRRKMCIQCFRDTNGATPPKKKAKSPKQAERELVIDATFLKISPNYNTTFKITRAALYFPKPVGGRATIDNCKKEGWTVGIKLLVDIDDRTTLFKLKKEAKKLGMTVEK